MPPYSDLLYCTCMYAVIWGACVGYRMQHYNRGLWTRRHVWNEGDSEVEVVCWRFITLSTVTAY